MKLWKPYIFQGSLRKKRYFEGWYFKHVSPALDSVYAFIPGISLTEDDPHAFVQVIDGITGITDYNYYSVDEFRWDRKRLDVRVGNSRFTDQGIKNVKETVGRAEAFFGRSGGWAVVLSRWLPILPEVIACMAGLARMPFGMFLAALLCGSVPMALVFAWLGHAGAESPAVAVAASALLPVLLWAAIRKTGLILPARDRREPGRTSTRT